MRTLRSILFIVFGYTAGTLYAATTLLLFWAPRDFLWRFVDSYCRLMLWAGDFFCGIRVVAEGFENLPTSPCVIMIKHSSALETYGHVPFFPRTTWVVKRELLWVPVFGWAMKLVFQPIAINRRSSTRAVKQVIRQGKQKLAEGTWVSIFPEGTRMPPGETRTYGISGAALATEAGVLIVPVAHNAVDFWQRRELAKRPGTVRMCIGPPIDPSKQSPKETNLLVQAWIENKMREISRAYQEKEAEK
ncbi:MAG: 1-acyl-sn-glycerol-3-phosphate acyltransferase [Gammaproteobacteria bacterium]|nr:1-acyl-sn-glycerol-3-phosphate acyltransferase [Gammaproteobacteria bacterium]MDH5263025.1 1-acyl-sn-glycerol-3-phosphate acyltransferase [Gammaproteobacteria bacterium]